VNIPAISFVGVANGVDALAVARRRLFDVAVVDLAQATRKQFAKTDATAIQAHIQARGQRQQARYRAHGPDPSLLRARHRLVQSNGYTVESFSSARAFLDASTRPACLVLDVHLNGTGLELQERHCSSRSVVPSGRTTDKRRIR